MKTKYEMPEIKVLQLHTENVIVTSSFANGLKSEASYDVSVSGSGGDWGDLFGQKVR